jgi:SAM-dependent methyltransferase
VAEYSAQRRSHPPSPALPKAIAFLRSDGSDGPLGTVADVGCGKLRHYRVLKDLATTLLLVDTERQMSREHSDGGTVYSIPRVAQAARKQGESVHALTFEELKASKRKIDVAFCIAVFDVVTRTVRKEISAVVSERLRDGGYFVIIVPRNDSTITDRFSSANRYQDGHVFAHHGAQTFFCNFKTVATITGDCQKVGLVLQRDLSVYRQGCLIFRKGD